MSTGTLVCNGEVNFYSPLTLVDHATSAVALTDEFQGDGLGAEGRTHGRRSAYIASFSEGSAFVAFSWQVPSHGED